MNNIIKMQINYSSTSSKYQMHQEFLPYYMPGPYFGNISAINNVSEFNNYIFERVPDKDIKTQGNESKSNDGINLIYCEPIHPNRNTPFYNELFNEKINNTIPWMRDTCFLYLIGTPEDIEELIMLPGIIVRAAYDETINFASEHLFKGESYSIFSTLHTKDQLIKYRLDSYYEAMPTWYNDYNGYGLLPTDSEGDIIELLDQPYSECPEFKDPKCLNTINPVCVHQINPDEHVYKIYIQMSDDLIRTAYERSNFFIRRKCLSKIL